MSSPDRSDQTCLRESRQTASRVLLVRPGSFGRNEAAAGSNAFMRSLEGSAGSVSAAARREFDGLAEALDASGVEVVIDEEPDLPDSVFPNNWMSYHEPVGRTPVLVTYPMATPLRRLERREAVIDRIRAAAGGELDRIQLEHLEDRGQALEGTGSLVLDRVAGVAFACRSNRTTDAALDAWGRETGFETVRFDAVGSDGTPIYHTNVMLSVGSTLAVVAAEAVRDPAERSAVLGRLEELHKSILDIDHAQMGGMCANVLELAGSNDEPLIAMSETAWNTFTGPQRAAIERVAQPIVADIPTIERVGGGSVRCMIAELGVQGL